MISLTQQADSISLEHSVTYKISKQHCLSHNPRIIKAIHNKITPLNVSPKTKFKMQLGQLPRPERNTEHQAWKNWERRVNQHQYHFQTNSFHDQDFSYLFPPTQKRKKQKLVKKAKTIGIRSSFEGQKSAFNHSAKIDFEKLPSIKRRIQRKKTDLTKFIQHNEMEFQWDTFRPMDQEKLCNLEYLVNRLNATYKRKKTEDENVEPLRGYENVSPNNLKVYIQMFKKKMTVIPQSIYVSKKRIPLGTKSSLGGEEGFTSKKFRLLDLKSEKLLARIQQRELQQQIRGTGKSITWTEPLGRQNGKKKLKKMISRKEIEESQIRKISQKKIVR